MFNYLRLSYNLLRLANSVLDRRKEKFKKELEGLDLSDWELNESLDCLIGIKDHLVRKMCIYWLKKKSIVLPVDLSKVEKAKDLVKGNRGVDYLTFNSPVEIIDKYTKVEGIKKTEYVDPDSLPELFDKLSLGEGVTVYEVEDSKEGQYAVRKLVDSHFGERFDDWCIIYRQRKEKKEERDDMGMMVKSYEHYWSEVYNAYPKRLAFKDGKLFALCANEDREILWWDKNNRGFYHIPGYEHLGDDNEFIKEYIISAEIEAWSWGGIDVEELIAHKDMTDAILNELIRYPDKDKRMELVQCEDLPDEFFNAMYDDNDVEIRKYIAEHTSDIYTLERLSGDEDCQVRLAVIDNYDVTDEILEIMSRDTDEKVRLAIAKRYNVSPDILTILSRDESAIVRVAVANNSNTPDDVLISMSSDVSAEVRRSIIEVIHLPEDVLFELSRDENADVRNSVAQNNGTPSSVLAGMSNDEDLHVRYRVAENPSTPAEDLIKLSKENDVYMRSFVAENRSTPESVLLELSNDSKVAVRISVARNFYTPVEALFELSKDESGLVRGAAQSTLNLRGIDV